MKLNRAILTKNTYYYILCFFLMLCFFNEKVYAQSCAPSTTTTLMKWDFSSSASQCNGASQQPHSDGRITPVLQMGMWTYCPDINSGCGYGVLGSRAHNNTPNYAGSLCLFHFYAADVLCPSTPTNCDGYDRTSSTWNPGTPINLHVTYTMPAGKQGRLVDFSLQLLQKRGSPNFEKQGFAVYRDGALIYADVQNITAGHVNGTPFTVAFPNMSSFKSDGSRNVTFKIVFGLVHNLVQALDYGSQTGYDNITLRGTCGGDSPPTASINPATCGATGPNSNGLITLANFAPTMKYDFSLGATYVGGRTFATATAIPANGIITSTLPNPATPQIYTIRVFSSTCYNDLQVTLNPTGCPLACNQPSSMVLTPTLVSCTGTTANNDAEIAITGVTNGDKIGFSQGSPYSGPAYAAANSLTAGAYTFTGLNNPTGYANYTVRIFNASNTCYIDKEVTLNEKVCGVCTNALMEIITSEALDPDSSPANNISGEDDQTNFQLCKGDKKINLRLTKTVTPNTGTTCPITTDFVWTITIFNDGDMDATDIVVSDALSTWLSLITSVPSVGTFNQSSGWLIPNLAAGTSATLTLTTRAIKGGTYINVAQIQSALPLNDPNSTPGNNVITEDDYAEATITVTGGDSPKLTLGFSPMLTKSNTPTRLTLKILNTSSTSATLTAPFVLSLPSTPAQMVIAATPALNTTLTGVIATAGATTITIPNGTVLVPGLNQIQVEITVPSDGFYCSTIAAGALQTDICNNLNAAEGCLWANSASVLAPVIRKTILPSPVDIAVNSTLTITLENRNSVNMTLNEAFVDYLPTNLIANGTVSGTCPNKTITNANTEVRIAAGSILTPGSCTIIVPVMSNTAATYTNTIPMNALRTTISGNSNVGNEDIAEASVVVNPPCAFIPTTTGITPICKGGTSTITATGGGTYLWSNGATTATINVSPTITTTYTVTVTQSVTCSKTATFMVTVRTLVVTNTNDAGEGTLRQAILCANAWIGLETITFNIPTLDPNYKNPDGIANNGDEYWNIGLAIADLPTVTDDLIIDGLTQTTTDCNLNLVSSVQNLHTVYPNSKGKKPRGMKLIANGGGISSQQVVLSSSATTLTVKGLIFVNWVSATTNGTGNVKLNPLTPTSRITLDCSFMNNKL